MTFSSADDADDADKESENSKFNVQYSMERGGLRHPELVSGSEELNRQMLKQVIRYAHRKSYLIS